MSTGAAAARGYVDTAVASGVLARVASVSTTTQAPGSGRARGGPKRRTGEDIRGDGSGTVVGPHGLHPGELHGYPSCGRFCEAVSYVKGDGRSGGKVASRTGWTF